ncbi:MAG TPA: gluconokinase [Niabella sp.]
MHTEYPKAGNAATIIVMGVSGSGKTIVGQIIAAGRGYEFIDADDLHPEANIQKMRAGIPLTDNDRWEWLNNIHTKALNLNDKGISVVFACSALKKSYRDLLRTAIEKRRFIYLKGSFKLIQQLLKSRKGHFMPIALLRSQFEALEEPGTDEQDCICIPITTLQEEIQEIDIQLKLSNL